MMIIILATDATSIFYTLFVVVIVAFLSFLLFKSIKKTYLKEKEDKKSKIEGVISKSEMNTLISTYIEKTGGNLSFSLIYIDLDKFDDFTTAFGQKESKNIIQKVAYKIKNSLPSAAYVSRYRGDEFIVFLPNQYNRGDVVEIAEELLDSFREKLSVFEDVEIDLTASIAVAQYPNHGKTIINLVQSLQLSIHHIKKEGGNKLKVYTKSLEDDEEEMNYYYQIKRAISNKEFELYYQPMLDTKTNQIYAYEALLRWDHPDLGVLSPNKFINIMEQTGDIHWVGMWGLETVIKKQFELKNINGTAPLFSLNISPKQLMNPNIAEDYSKILKRYKVEAHDFILEIGEFLIFEKQQVVFENLIKLKKLDFKLAIDEFGIDISSFDQLDKMGIDIFKIDFKFIGEDTFSVNRYMEFFMEYTDKNSKTVVCQGVETATEEVRAKGFGIDKMQGYYYSKPMKSDIINDFSYKSVDN